MAATDEDDAPPPHLAPVSASPGAAATAVSVGPAERAGAIVTLERIYASTREPDLLLAIGRLYQQAATDGGDPRDKRLAVLAYERYLAEKGPGADRPGVNRALLLLGEHPLTAEPEAAPASTRIPVHFAPYWGLDRYTVMVGDQTCTTPCTLDLLRGPTTITATGSGDVSALLVIPRLPALVRLQHDGSSPYLIAGSVLVPVGALMASGMWALALTCNSNGSGNGCEAAHLITWPILGAAALFTGIGLLAVIRKHRPSVDANRIEILEARARPTLRLASLGLMPTATGVQGGVGFVF